MQVRKAVNLHGWSSNSQDGSNYGVFTQRYDAAGVAQGSEFQVNSTPSGAVGSCEHS